MKRLTTALVALLLAAPALADHRNHPETRTAERLVQTLEYLSYDARSEADAARRQGDLALWRDLNEISRTSSEIASRVENRILWLLRSHSGNDLAGARRELSNIGYQFDRLYQTAWQVRRLSFSISRSVEEVRRLQDELEYELDNCDDHPWPGPGPGPGRDTWECKAVDAGWEEHAGGHPGYGRNQREAEREAVLNCEQFHGRCRVTSCRIVR